MSTTISISANQKVPVRYLKVEAAVRYWEDATVNGEVDEFGYLIPFKSGGLWEPTIDLETGLVEGWPIGTEADIHYKVCDSGRYALLDDSRNEIKYIEGYVPNIMCPQDSGYGDYIIIKIDCNGAIQGWRIDLSNFERAA